MSIDEEVNSLIKRFEKHIRKKLNNSYKLKKSFILAYVNLPGFGGADITAQNIKPITTEIEKQFQKENLDASNWIGTFYFSWNHNNSPLAIGNIRNKVKWPKGWNKENIFRIIGAKSY